jgi:hypothetical protein
MRLRWPFDKFVVVMTLPFFIARFERDELLMECAVLAGEASAAEAAAVFKKVRRSRSDIVSPDGLECLRIGEG